jgi:membrane associated rhomboid family serine protease
MRPPTPPRDILKYPVTGGISMLAIGITLAWMDHFSIDPLVMNGILFFREPWRLVTTILPHMGFLHLAFDVYWFWAIGTLMERRFGHARMALIVLFLAVGSSAAEWAVFSGGVGLSGVGYGLFGMLWVLSKTDPQFTAALDFQTIVIFMAWLVLCILTTVQGTMAVANVAHIAGLILGAILGWLIARPRHRPFAIGVAAAALGICLLGATVWRPYVNFSYKAGEEYSYAGYLELRHGNAKSAARLLEQAVRFRGTPAGTWFNLGIAYQQLDLNEKAVRSYQEALRRDPSDAAAAASARRLQGALNSRAATRQSQGL